MSNLFLAFSVVFPLFCMLALGYILRLVKIFNDDFLAQLNKLCFKVFLPLILFINVYKSDFSASFNGKLILFAVLAVFAAWAILMLIVPLFDKRNENRGVIVQGIFRSNYILFGIPIAISLFGAENTGTTAVLVAFIIPLFNLLSVLTLARFSDVKPTALSVLKSIVTNPLIIGSLCAFFFVLTKLRLPTLVENTVSDISKVATPLALIVLGGSFKFHSLTKYIKPLIFSVVGKLILMPTVFVIIATLIGFRGMQLAAIFAMFASPTAVSTYTMAQNAKANDELAGQIVVIDSILSVLTIFVGITILRSLALI